MNSRRTLSAVAVALVAAAGVAPAVAAPRKPMSGNFTFRDATPDPTGNAESGNERHCSGRLPQETPIKVKAPAPGKMKVSIAGFHGDWSLQIRDGKGNIIGGTDVNPPETESVTVKVKKGEVQILPCNLTGTPDATGKWTLTFS